MVSVRGRPRPRVLVVAADSEIAEFVGDILEDTGCEVRFAAGEASLNLASSWGPRLIVMDISLEDGSGFGVLRRLAGLPAAPRIVVVTGRPTAQVIFQIVRDGAVGFLPRPFSMEQLVDVCLQHLESPRLARQLESW